MVYSDNKSGSSLSGGTGITTNPNEQRARDNLLFQSMNDQEKMAQGIFFLIAMILGIKDDPNLQTEEAASEIADSLSIDATAFFATIQQVTSNEITVEQALTRTVEQLKTRQVDTSNPAVISPLEMAKAQEAVSKYADSGNPILELITDHEASGGNYNVIYGGDVVNLTGMTLDEVQNLQDDMSKKLGTSAVGKFQIMGFKLEETMDQMGLKGTDVFDEKLQERIGQHLLAQTGYHDYVAGTLPEDKFMKNLSRMWAAVPKDMSGDSYYQDDKMKNKALFSPAEMIVAMRTAKQMELAGTIPTPPAVLAARETKEKPNTLSTAFAFKQPSTPIVAATVESSTTPTGIGVLRPEFLEQPPATLVVDNMLDTTPVTAEKQPVGWSVLAPTENAPNDDPTKPLIASNWGLGGNTGS